MTPRTCLIKDDPEAGKYGDCVRACIATLIDRDDVPHVFDERIFRNGQVDEQLMHKAWNELRAYLAQHGKFIMIFATADHVDTMAEVNPGVPYILWHKNGDGGNHVVICRDGKKIHDPSWYPSSIAGPRGDGLYLIGVIGNMV